MRTWCSRTTGSTKRSRWPTSPRRTRATSTTQVGWRTARARVMVRRGRGALAERLIREGIGLAEQTDSTDLRASALVWAADVRRRAGRPAEAEPFERRALRLFERRGATAQAASVAARLAPAPNPVAPPPDRNSTPAPEEPASRRPRRSPTRSPRRRSPRPRRRRPRRRDTAGRRDDGDVLRVGTGAHARARRPAHGRGPPPRPLISSMPRRGRLPTSTRRTSCWTISRRAPRKSPSAAGSTADRPASVRAHHPYAGVGRRD